MQHIKLDRKCLWSTGDLQASSRSPQTRLSVISAFLASPAMCFYECMAPLSSAGRETEWKEERKAPLWLLIVLVSPLDFCLNCSTLPGGSLLLRTCATLFFTAFHEYHFAKQVLWGICRPQYLSHAGLLSLQYIWHSQHFEVIFSHLFALIKQNVVQGFNSRWSESRVGN